MLAIKEYPTPTTPGMFNGLLAAPFPFCADAIVWIFIESHGAGAAAAPGTPDGQCRAILRSRKPKRLRDALDALTSNEFVMGEHHLSLQVQTPWVRPGAGEAERAIGQLQDDVALARSLLADCGMTVAREDLALEAAFWAQLPGAFSWRPRASVITSRNFAAMAPFHDYPEWPGHRAITGARRWRCSRPVRAGRITFHCTRVIRAIRRVASRRDTGHTLICGPTGSGKTVFIGFLMAMLAKQGVTQIVFDKDHGLEVLVRALGGAYCPLAAGEPTGLNPLQLRADAGEREFLERLAAHAGAAAIGRAARSHGAAGGGSWSRRCAARSRCRSGLDACRACSSIWMRPTPKGLHARLAPWCAVDGRRVGLGL